MNVQKVVCPIIAAGTGSDVYYSRLKQALAPIGITVDIISLPYRYEFIPALCEKVKKKLKGYDLIHTNVDYANKFYMSGKPLVATFHHNVFDPKNFDAASILQKTYYTFLLKRQITQSLRCANAIVCPSNYTYESVSKDYGIYLNRVSVIYNAIDTEAFLPLPLRKRDCKKLLFVGSRTRRKGFGFVEDLMEVLGPKGYTLICVGNPNSGYRTRYVEYTGRIPESELIALYQSSGCFLSPSRLEGFGYSVLEAALCGCPIVTTGLSAIREVLSGYSNCVFVEDYNVQLWVEAIEIISGKHNQELMEYEREKFSFNSMAVQYKELYASLN